MSDLERRLQRVVQMASVLGVLALVFGIGQPAGDKLALLVGANLLYGGWVHVRPHRLVAMGWTMWALGTCLTYYGMTYELHPFAHLPLPIAYHFLGAMLVVVGPIALIVAMASSADHRELPPARMVAG